MHSIVTTFRGAVIKVEVANFCAAMDTLIDQDAEEVKEQLFLAYCESLYCAALWSNYTDTVLTQLHVAHNNIFRLLFRLPTRGTTYNFIVRNIPNLLVKR